ncbi:MAG: hypothetical protein QM723_34385 [Myxococcaceae bacterium]
MPRAWIPPSVAALLLSAELLATPDAAACSCMGSRDDLPTQLRNARDESNAIYRAAIVECTKPEPDNWCREARAKVLEVFKGSVKAGDELTLRAGGGGDCTVGLRQGEEWLMYAYRRPTNIGLCSRTRQLKPGKVDREVEWLAGRRPMPTVPVAAQVETVTCTPCSLDTVGGSLVGGMRDKCYFDRNDALAALKNKTPFFEGGYYGPDTSKKTATGFGMRRTDGGSYPSAFELIQRPDYSTEEMCRQRVTIRWCAGLKEREVEIRGEPTLACDEPGPETQVCDETPSRRATWGPVKDISSVGCEWHDPEWPHCVARDAGYSLDAGAPPFPLLRCMPRYGSFEGDLKCHVVNSLEEDK